MIRRTTLALAIAALASSAFAAQPDPVGFRPLLSYETAPDGSRFQVLATITAPPVVAVCTPAANGGPGTLTRVAYPAVQDDQGNVLRQGGPALSQEVSTTDDCAVIGPAANISAQSFATVDVQATDAALDAYLKR